MVLLPTISSNALRRNGMLMQPNVLSYSRRAKPVHAEFTMPFSVSLKTNGVEKEQKEIGFVFGSGVSADPVNSWKKHKKTATASRVFVLQDSRYFLHLQNAFLKNTQHSATHNEIPKTVNFRRSVPWVFPGSKLVEDPANWSQIRFENIDLKQFNNPFTCDTQIDTTLPSPPSVTQKRNGFGISKDSGLNFLGSKLKVDNKSPGIASASIGDENFYGDWKFYPNPEKTFMMNSKSSSFLDNKMLIILKSKSSPPQVISIVAQVIRLVRLGSNCAGIRQPSNRFNEYLQDIHQLVPTFKMEEDDAKLPLRRDMTPSHRINTEFIILIYSIIRFKDAATISRSACRGKSGFFEETNSPAYMLSGRKKHKSKMPKEVSRALGQNMEQDKMNNWNLSFKNDKTIKKWVGHVKVLNEDLDSKCSIAGESKVQTNEVKHMAVLGEFKEGTNPRGRMSLIGECKEEEVEVEEEGKLDTESSWICSVEVAENVDKDLRVVGEDQPSHAP